MVTQHLGGLKRWDGELEDPKICATCEICIPQRQQSPDSPYNLREVKPINKMSTYYMCINIFQDPYDHTKAVPLLCRRC